MNNTNSTKIRPLTVTSDKKSTTDFPLITVITVVYNSVNSLENTIISVLNQSYKNIEYIIIDGGSTDGTLDIITKYNDKIDYWISEPDMGIYDAMNKGLEVTTGEWIYFLGSDDILLESMSRVSCYLQNSNTIYYGNAFFTKDQIIYDGKFNSLKIVMKNICHQAIFYPKSVFTKYKYNLKYKTLADYELNIKLWGDKKFDFKYIPITLSIFNQFGACNQTIDKQFLIDKYKIISVNISFLLASILYTLDSSKTFLKRILRYKYEK